MKSLTVRLQDQLVLEIQRESLARGVSKSDIVRERLGRPTTESGAGGNMQEMIGDVLERSWKARTPSHPPQFDSARKQKLAGTIRAKKLHR